VLRVIDAPIQALAAQHANLDLDHVQPTGVLWDIVELQAAEQASRFVGMEGLTEAAEAALAAWGL
jgi:hypothetical protein